MKTLYKELIPLREFGGDMVERLKAHSVYHIFKPLIEAYEHDTDSLNKALFYVLMVYSKDSEAMRPGISWEQLKLAVCQELDITDGLQFDLIDCMIDGVNQSIEAYLDYQGSKVWEHLTVVRDLYEEMKRSARSRIMKGESIDYDQKRKNLNYASELYQEIVLWENRLHEEEINVSEGRKEIAKKMKPVSKTRKTLRVEDIIEELRAQTLKPKPAADEQEKAHVPGDTAKE